MITLFLGLSEAEALREILARAGLLSVRRQLDAQLSIERLLPHDYVPELVVRYGGADGVVHEVFDQERADVAWEAMGAALRRPKDKTA